MASQERETRGAGADARGVMVKGFPVGAVSVPIEPRPGAFPLDPKVLAQAVYYLLERGRASRVLADEMGALVPGDPLALRVQCGVGGDVCGQEKQKVSSAESWEDTTQHRYEKSLTPRTFSFWRARISSTSLW